MRNRSEMSRNRGNGSGLFGSADQRVADTNRRLMEQQNNGKISALEDQVSRLKELTIDINAEVEEQNRLLGDMGGEMSSASDLLQQTLGKLGVMLNSGGSSHMVYLIGFIVFSFLVIYFIMTHKRAPTS
uniref:t-SNARE coiled-coil homology domain-containing protein n=1 Tax=Rhizochromulina marina TaxID=1034831 RepID=A0A7S2S2C5_9STRA|mmetsp:Transcript_24104/g.70693  ORF Transcript_24104/g.70693 Transcript_24104/m.70693 type:complete len:129 (+) Transcript_24104:93-479(+)